MREFARIPFLASGDGLAMHRPRGKRHSFMAPASPAKKAAGIGLANRLTGSAGHVLPMDGLGADTGKRYDVVAGTNTFDLRRRDGAIRLSTSPTMKNLEGINHRQCPLNGSCPFADTFFLS